MTIASQPAGSAERDTVLRDPSLQECGDRDRQDQHPGAVVESLAPEGLHPWQVGPEFPGHVPLDVGLVVLDEEALQSPFM